MPDISLCSNTNCPLRYRCGRYLAIPDMHWQSYADFQPIAMKCDGFWDVQEFPYRMDGCKNADERNQKLEDGLKVKHGEYIYEIEDGVLKVYRVELVKQYKVKQKSEQKPVCVTDPTAVLPKVVLNGDSDVTESID